MEAFGWKPLDLLVGGMLTAGVAFGFYKFGRINKLIAIGAATELDSSGLHDCIALVRRSELEISVPQPEPECRRLATSLAQSMKAEASSRDGVGRLIQTDSKQLPKNEVDTYWRPFVRQIDEEEMECHSSDHSPPKRRRFPSNQPYYSPLLMNITPPELTRQLQSYRDTLDKLTADSEAKMEKIEQQRMSLSTELHVTREALQAERRHRAEAEQRRQRAETKLKELEGRLQRFSDSKEELSRRGEEVQRLEHHLREMEEQLEGLYMHNVVTPRQAVRDNVEQHQQLSDSLQQSEAELERQQQDIQDMENEIINLSMQLNKARKDGRHLSEDNTILEKQLHGAQEAARDLVALLYERSAGKENDTTELTHLLNAPDSDLPLDKLLECVRSLLLRS